MLFFSHFLCDVFQLKNFRTLFGCTVLLCIHSGHNYPKTEDRTELTETETELTETELFGHKFGPCFQLTELYTVSSGISVG